ncbi:MAG: NAD(P)/FAD-dependent oxidoreductase [Nocardioides sp.]
MTAVVVGGGVAGLVTALLLAEADHEVALVERRQLGADSVSTHYFGRTLIEFFESRGLSDALFATGAPRLRAWHVGYEGSYFGGPMGTEDVPSYNLTVRRRHLTRILGEFARSRGRISVFERASVTGLLRDGDAVTGVVLRDGTRLRADLVVGADGFHSGVARQARAGTQFDAGPFRVATHAYWTGVMPLPTPSLELWHAGDAVVQLAPCDGEQWVVMLSTDQARGHRRDEYVARIREFPGLGPRFATASVASPVYHSGPVPNRARRCAGPGWRLVGDALCFKDPLFGSGLTDALRAATALVATADLPPHESSAAYARRVAVEVVERLRQDVGQLALPEPRAENARLGRTLLRHPALALDLKTHASDLIGGLAPERRAFWAAAAGLAETSGP